MEGKHEVQFAPTTAQVFEAGDPYRVEIKENSKGEPSVSVRATAPDSVQAVRVAVQMYMATHRALKEDE